MDSRITSAVLSAVCALWVALSGVADAQTENFNEEDSKPVLGVIIPGKTTLSDFEEVLTSKGCHFSEGQPEKDGLGSEITISNSCFDLPGKPIVHAGCDKQGVVSMLKIEWTSDEDASL
ncbi:MAG: hypothetical protein LUC43_07635 [Burkholderiales bacterium]|nr:hypothetical protein [Burkholderiales bacterium]